MDTTLTIQPAAARLSRRGVATLWLVGAMAMAFVVHTAVPYFSLSETQFGRYWPRRWWLLLHISAGTFALLSGPVQLWLGLTNRRRKLHRQLGTAYVGSVAVSSLAGYYLAFNTNFGWVFGAGLASLATAWVVTTSLAVVAIRRRQYEQHKEWMIRSYVATTAFVTFRLFFLVLEQMGIGTPIERLTAMSWLCWAPQLLIAEAILQGRKIFATADPTSERFILSRSGA
jgi:uncharacterized membrane protein